MSRTKLIPYSQFSRDAVARMQETHTMVGIAAIMGDAPRYYSSAAEGRSTFNIGKIIKFLQRGLLSETFLAEYEVTADDFQMEGIRSRAVSLDYYVWRKIASHDERDKMFPRLVEKLRRAEEDKRSARTARTVDTDDDDFELVAFMSSGKDQGIRLIGKKKLERLRSTSPDAKFKIITHTVPGWFLKMYHDIGTDYFSDQEQMSLGLEQGETTR